ncbi:DUF6221 family protein [Streptomyces galilaeus]|uniref:DUF6221 family protein n=1 Tax=Streptomyces galilaeus TaxID=33899 RepID=A0ABW9IMV5_STRGJ
MDDLVQWLRAQLDEDERIAREATPGPWEWLTETGESWQPRLGGWLDYSGEYLAAPGDGATLFGPGMTPHADAVFIAAHDPARVLREIEAKRQLLTEILRYEAKIDGEWGCCHDPDEIATGQCAETQPQDITALRLLALPFADRPGYQESWRP